MQRLLVVEARHHTTERRPSEFDRQEHHTRQRHPQKARRVLSRGDPQRSAFDPAGGGVRLPVSLAVARPDLHEPGENLRPSGLVWQNP